MRMHFTIIQNIPFLKEYTAEKCTGQVNAPALYIYGGTERGTDGQITQNAL